MLNAVPNAGEPASAQLLFSETRWHYSVHFHAEARGEEVIENLLSLANCKRQRALLGAQLRDEAEHTRLFSKITDEIGLDSRADSYANGYADLVKSQNSLAEKVFVFQILTEAASAAYCEWRLLAMEESSFSAADKQVRDDENRHLLMGQSMLRICDPDELQRFLPRARRTELLRAMNEVCKAVSQKEMVRTLYGSSETISPKTTLLDRMISRSVLHEVRAADRVLELPTLFEEVTA
ncbi:MAG: hypothetical protein V4692_07910 [Bdellovibrionota bacterium]